MVDLEAFAKECGVRFYDAETTSENGRTIYRVYITKKGGVSLDECEKLSRLLSPIFDVEPPVGGEWFLEVSSPGLERKLVKPEHFDNSLGELARVTLCDKTKCEGEILGFADEILRLKTDGGEREIAFSDIKKAHTYIEW